MNRQKFDKTCLIRPRSLLFLGIISIASAPVASFAKNYDAYRSDYAKGAFCSAIAGACASDFNPENSFFQNPASLESSTPDLVYDGDYNPSDNLEPGMKVGNEVSDSTFMGGVAHAGPEWGLGFAFSGRLSQVKASSTLFDDNDVARDIKTTTSGTTLTFNIPAAIKLTPNLVVGAALLGLYYKENINIEEAPSSNSSAIDKLPKLGLSIGALFTLNQYFRVGSWFRTPITYSVHQHIDYQKFGSPLIFDEDINLKYPFMSATGISIMPWGDTRTLFVDIDVVGTTLYGFERTLDTFEGAANDRALRAKGRKAVIEPHIAWRSPWWTESLGTFTVGYYFETSRWRGLPGRNHLVASVSYKLSLGEPIIALDVAPDYFGMQISFR